MIEKLILGTAGLGGQPYGRNKRAVSLNEACQLILAAAAIGITKFDTAPAYGFAEEAIGLAQRAMDQPFEVITKNNGDADQAARSLKNLKGCKVDFFWHNFSGEIKPGYVYERGKLAHWINGATVYGRHGFAEAMGVFQNIQVNWNIFEQTDTMTGRNETIYARSIFLQGVLCGGELPDQRLAPYLDRAKIFADACGVSLTELALKSALERSFVDYVVVGPTTQRELYEIVACARTKPLGIRPNHLAMLDVGDSDLTDPRKWNAA